MHRVLKFLDDHVEEVLIFTVFSLMSIIIFFQVIMRYIFQSSLSWSEEIARYLFIWLIYIGVSYAAKKNSHVAVTATELVLSPKHTKWIRLTAHVIFLAFAMCVFYYARQVCSTILRLGQQSPALDIPMWAIYAAVPTGFCLTCIRQIQNIRRQILDWNSELPVPRPLDDRDAPIL